MSDAPDIRKVLLVDDEPDIRRIAQLSLERVGRWQVVLAISGAETQALADKPARAAVCMTAYPGM